MDIVGSYRRIYNEARAAVAKDFAIEDTKRLGYGKFGAFRWAYPSPLRALWAIGLLPYSLLFIIWPLGYLFRFRLSPYEDSIERIALGIAVIQFLAVLEVVRQFVSLDEDELNDSYYRSQCVATKARDLWFAKSKTLTLDSLKKAVELDIHFQEMYLNSYLGLFGVLIFVITIDKLCFGGGILPIPGKLENPVALMLFNICLTRFLLRYIPLQWMKQVGAFIVKEAFTDTR